MSARVFAIGGIHGGGFANTVDVRPDGRALVGIDVGGIYWSEDYGDSWTPSNVGLWSPQLLSVACIRFSDVIADRAYSLHGKAGVGGGFGRSVDGGKTFQIVSATPQFSGGNNPDTGPLPRPHPRSTRGLLAMDEANGYLYVATYNQGVYRSQNGGSSWTYIGLTGHYLRSIFIDPSNPLSIYVSSYGSGSGLTSPGVYHCSSPRIAVPTWSVMSGSPATPEQLWVSPRGLLYVGASYAGVARYNGSSWSTILVDGAAWETVNGYAGDTADVVYVGCFDPVKDLATSQFPSLKVSTDDGGTFTDPLLTAANIKDTMNDATGAQWWLAVGQANQQLGRGSSVVSEIAFSEDHSTILLAGRAGLYRSVDAGVTFYPIDDKLGVTISRCLAASRTHAGSVLIGLTDWVAGYSHDYLETFVMHKPSPNTALAVALDPVDDTGYLADGARDSNSLGRVWKVAYPWSAAWTDLGLQGSATSFLDFFDRTVAGPGWGTATDGTVWVGATSGLSVAPGEGRIFVASGSVSAAAAVGFTDMIAQAAVRWNVLPAGASHGGLIDVRRVSNTFYSARIRQLTNGDVVLSIDKTVAGVITVLNGGVEITIDSAAPAATIYQLMLSCDGSSPTSLKVKAWRDGDEEPAGWAIEITDSEATLQSVSGDIRLRGQAFGGSTANPTVIFSSLQVTNLSAVGGTGGKRPLGMIVIRDASNVPIVLAAVEEHGIVRHPVGSSSTDVDTTIFMQTPATTKSAIFAWSPLNPQYVYLFDRDTGIGRSDDYGLTWELIWTVTDLVDLTGYIATPDGIDLYVTLENQALLIVGANVGTVDAPVIPPPPDFVMGRGTASFLSHSINTKTAFTNHATSIVSAWLDWSVFEPTQGVFVWGTLDDADNGFADAHDKGYEILLRFAAGVDAPIGRPGTSQAAWLSTVLSVPRIRTFDNDPPGAFREDFIPLPSSAAYRTAYDAAMAEIGAFLDSPCIRDPSHKRSAHCYGVMASAPTENGTEMSIGYSRNGTATFVGASLTLVSGLATAGATGAFVTSGSTAGMPTGLQLVQLNGSGGEWILCSSRSGNTFTPRSDGRGWQLSTAVGHSAGESVRCADQSHTTGTAAAPATYNGVSGIYDRWDLNKAAWRAVDGFTTDNDRRDMVRDAWINCIEDMAATLPADVAVMVAIGGIFADGNVRADAIITAEAASLGERLLVGVTDIRNGSYRTTQAGAIGHYASARADNDATLAIAIAGGAQIWGQTSGVAQLSQGQHFVDAIEAFIVDYDPLFIETNANTRFTATRYTTWAALGWPGGTNLLTKDYFCSSPNSVKARLEAL